MARLEAKAAEPRAGQSKSISASDKLGEGRGARGEGEVCERRAPVNRRCARRVGRQEHGLRRAGRKAGRGRLLPCSRLPSNAARAGARWPHGLRPAQNAAGPPLTSIPAH